MIFLPNDIPENDLFENDLLTNITVVLLAFHQNLENLSKRGRTVYMLLVGDVHKKGTFSVSK